MQKAIQRRRSKPLCIRCSSQLSVLKMTVKIIVHEKLLQALTTDPMFVRVKKGFYALRCCMGDAPYESVGGRAKKPKPSIEVPATAQVSKEKPPSIEVAAKQPEREQAVCGNEPEPPLRSIEASLTSLIYAGQIL